jgi:hypothetical protein
LDEFKGKDSEKQGETRYVFEYKIVVNWLNLPGRPLLAPIYRWPGLEEPVGFNTHLNANCNMILYFDYGYTWAYLS